MSHLFTRPGELPTALRVCPRVEPNGSRAWSPAVPVGGKSLAFLDCSSGPTFALSAVDSVYGDAVSNCVSGEKWNQNKLERVLRSLTMDHWIGAPIPPRRRPDGLRASAGVCVRLGSTILGHIWTEWRTEDSRVQEVLCRKLVGETAVVAASIDMAATAYLLAAEWASKQDVDSLFD